MISAKRRPRRIAADEAHSWARHLRLRNPGAKDLLKNLTLYVDAEGYCWVGIPTLAEDLEMSPDTIRRRLTWLERDGAISRQSQWIDEYGARNGQGRGRRTTDLICLLIDADVELIEARAAGETVDAENDSISTASDPSNLRGSDGAVDPRNLRGSDPPAGTRLALGRPSQSCEGLISEPEPEPESPKAPDGGVSELAQANEDEETEPQHFAEAWASWPAKLRRDLALAEFRELTADERRLCRAAIPPFLAMLRHLKRSHVPNFSVWIRSKGFREFPTAVLEEAQASQGPRSYDVASREGRALKAMFGFARLSLFESRGRVLYPLPVTARVLAFAEMPPEPQWHLIEAPAQVAAWSTFLSAHIHLRRPDLGSRFMAPWPWPPRKDGTISASATNDEAGESE